MKHQKTSTAKRLRVLIAEDQPDVRKGLQAVLQLENDIQVVGTAANGLEAVELAERLRPDVVLMDWCMPHLDGYEAAQRIRDKGLAVRIIALATHGDPALRQKPEHAGVVAIIDKGSPDTQLAQVIRSVCQAEQSHNGRSGDMPQFLPWNYANSYEWMEKLRQGFYPLMITCALNGGIQGKESHPALPETPKEIAEQAYEAYNAGACILHIHGRNPRNWTEAAKDAETYLEINARVREKCPDIIINNTTGGGPTTTMEERYRCLEAMPEMASLNMGPDMSRFTVRPRPIPFEHPRDGFEFDGCVPFTYGIIEQLAQTMLVKMIKPEMEMYQSGQYWVSQNLIEKGLLKPPYIFQFVMGYQTSIYPTPANLIAMVHELPPNSFFFVVGIGPFQLPLNTMAILMGGHVRVGLEDNLYLRRGQKFKGNGEAVERIVRLARELNREIATPAQARQMLGLSPTPSQYPDFMRVSR